MNHRDPDRSCRRRTTHVAGLRWGWPIVGVLLSLWLAIAGCPEFAAGQAEPENPGGPAVYESADSDATTAPDLQRKKNALWLAFMMWAGVIFGGVILLTLVVMWGNRTRRLARSPLPPIAKRDELWFLKPKPPAGNADNTLPSDSGSDAGS